MSDIGCDQLLGVAEVCALLGLSRGALGHRRRRPDFPEPVALLDCGPIWARSQIVAYAAERCSRLEERPGVAALAGEAGSGGGLPGELTARQVAELAHVHVDRVVELAHVLPCRVTLAMGIGTGVSAGTRVSLPRRRRRAGA